MIDPTKININELPKKLCDGALGGYNKEIFSFALISGNAIDSYASTPQVMKSIAVWMNNQIRDYEQQFGNIDLTPPTVKSPIQPADLGD